MSTLQLFFEWPTGGVYSNIIASILWTTPSFAVGFILSHRRLKRHINNHMKELHRHIGMKDNYER